MGYAKPEKEMYEIILKRLDVKPEEAIFIDDRKENTEKARKMGIKNVLFSDINQMIYELKKQGVIVE